MKKKSLPKIIIATVLSFLSSVKNVSAELTNPVVTGALGRGSADAASGDTFGSYFIFFWNSIISIGAIMVLVFFIWGAMEWISSGGEKGKVENARNRITQAVIGLIVLVGAYAIIGFISEIFFGTTFNVLQINIPDPI